MSEQSQQQDPLLSVPAQSDLAGMILKIQKQLDFLEKKIDILVSQSPAKPFAAKRFSKPARPYTPSHRYAKTEHDPGYRTGDRERGRRSEKPASDVRTWPEHKKKPFYHKFVDRKREPS